MINVRTSFTVGVLASFCSTVALTHTPPGEPLVLQAKIPLGDVRGRIDHLAVDLKRQRLFVAELGNNSVDVIDLSANKVLKRVSGLAEPQGLGYVPERNLLIVANGGDGAVRFYDGTDFSPRGVIALGDDADNVRVDPRNGHVLVGFGTGHIAVIDPVKLKWLTNIPMPSHPESFRISLATGRMFVNVPTAGKIVMVDLATGTGASWIPRGLDGNFPMALDEAHRAIIVVFRSPPRVATFDMMTGAMITSIETCGDSDDAFIDGKRNLVYVICGAGYVDVLAARGETYTGVSRISTVSGARTGLFVPELDRLYVAARAHGSAPAEVWDFRSAN